jgi:hypothetical protein
MFTNCLACWNVGCNIYTRDDIGTKIWSNDVSGQNVNFNVYNFTGDYDNFIIDSIIPRDAIISTIYDSATFNLHLSFNYENVLTYINTTYSQNYLPGVNIDGYAILVLNMYNGLEINVGTGIVP